MKDDCIFCKLANGVFPTNSIYEDEDFKVILDLAPATRGHALILPKEHADNIYEMPQGLVGKAFLLAQKMVKHMTEKLECDGFNLVQNNGIVAGQTVYHFHIHMIPRYVSDNQNIAWVPGEATEEEVKAVKDLLNK